jgi:hypothetical protein
MGKEYSPGEGRERGKEMKKKTKNSSANVGIVQYTIIK